MASKTVYPCKKVQNGEVYSCSDCKNTSCQTRQNNTKTAQVQILEGYNKEIQLNKKSALCIDIGTSTIVFEYFKNGVSVDTFCAINPQKTYGADVLSRIKAANEGMGNELKRLVCNTLADGVEKLCNGEKIDEAIISGNTAMVHLLLGYPCDSLGVYPFSPYNTDTVYTSFSEITGIIAYDFPTTIIGAVGAYIGGDIVSGILFSGMAEDSDISLFIDLGTNGEMAIGNKEGILCTSTAAGPAFEGGRISCGVPCVEGAVYEVDIKNNTVKTIGNKTPIGICGSGIIDLIAKLREENIVDKTGLLIDEYFDNGYRVCENVILTQSDIREIQMAKAAIRSGIDILIKNYGAEEKDIKNVCLAGGFGNGIDVTSAAQIGIIPPKIADRVVSLGNSSLGGAVKCVMEDLKDKVEYIRKISKEIILGNDDEFGEKYFESMNF